MKELLTDIVGPRWAKRLDEIYRTPRGLGGATAKDLVEIGLPEGKAKALTAGVWLVMLLGLALGVVRSRPGTYHNQIAAAAFAGVLRCGDRELAA